MQVFLSSQFLVTSMPKSGASVGWTVPFVIGTGPGRATISSGETPGGATVSERSPIGIAGIASARC